MKSKNIHWIMILCLSLTLLLLLAGCGGAGDEANEADPADAVDAEGCQMTPRELSAEEMAAIDLVSSDKDVGYAIFDYHFDDSYKGMSFRMNVYQNGELQGHGLLICGISFDDEDSRDGAVSVVMEETGFRVKIRDNGGSETSGSRDAQDYLKISGNGGGHFSSREGEKDVDNHMILYTAGVFEGAARRLSPDTDITKAIEEDSKTFDTYIVVYAEGY